MEEMKKNGFQSFQLQARVQVNQKRDGKGVSEETTGRRLGCQNHFSLRTVW